MKSLYLSNRLFLALGLSIFLFMLGFAYPAALAVAKVSVLVWVLLLAVDLFMLYQMKEGLRGSRDCAEKLSNGDENPVYIHLENRYPFEIQAKIIDEAPVQFQLRNLEFIDHLKPRARRVTTYHLRPVRRGEYRFGALNVFVSAIIGFASRRYRFDQEQVTLA